MFWQSNRVCSSCFSYRIWTDWLSLSWKEKKLQTASSILKNSSIFKFKASGDKRSSVRGFGSPKPSLWEKTQKRFNSVTLARGSPRFHSIKEWSENQLLVAASPLATGWLWVIKASSWTHQEKHFTLAAIFLSNHNKLNPIFYYGSSVLKAVIHQISLTNTVFCAAPISSAL